MNNISRFTLFYFIGLILFLGSCTKMDDLYKGAENQESTLFDGDVVLPEAFNWESSKAVDVHIAVDDNYNGKYFYRVELYDADPKLTSANILGAGVAKLGQDYTDKIMVPTAAKYVYVKTTSPVGIAAISMIEVGNKTTVSLNRAASGTRANKMVATLASSTTGGSGSIMMATTSIPAVTVPADAIAISGSETVSLSPNKNYVIKSGSTFSGSINNENGQGTKLYVEGTWINANQEIQIKENATIYVLSSGTIELKKVSQHSTTGFFKNYGTSKMTDMSVENASLFENDGSLIVDNKISLNGGGSFTNLENGQVTVKDIYAGTSPSVLVNEGTLTVTGNLELQGGADFTNQGTTAVRNILSRSGESDFRNTGALTVEIADLSGGSRLYANCHTLIGSFKVEGAKVFVAEGALLSVGTLSAGGGEFNLDKSSILAVSGTAKFTSWTSKIIGTGTTDAVARFKKVELELDGRPIEYSGNLEVACSDHTPNGQWNIYYTITSPARIVNYDQSTVVIAATACNAGGNNDAGAGTDPDDQTAPEVSLGTYSYAFEDNWPSFGDYDMNDFVVDMEITKFQNTENKVTKVALKSKLRSVGAAKRMAAAIQLDGVPANNVKGVTYSNSSIVGTSFSLSSNGTESGQTYAVVPITSDAHKAFGLSEVEFVFTKDGKFSPVELTITVEFNAPLDNFTYENLNVFIINFMQNKAGRNEVHMAGYKATDKINSSLVKAEVNSGLLSSVNQPFKSKKGYPWAIAIPVSFDYPAEAKNIKDVFPNFKSWAISGGELHQDWYMN